MRCEAIKDIFAFARNPIVLEGSWPDEANDPEGGWFTVSADGKEVYTGRFFPPMRLDISEIVDAFTPYYPEPDPDNPEPVAVVIDSSTDHSGTCFSIEAEYDSFPDSFAFQSFPGGVSRQNFARYLQTGSDPFLIRFLNPKGNFFLTTRNPGWLLRIRETELQPLYFIEEQQTEISIKERLTGKLYEPQLTHSGIYTLDPEKLRHYFFSNYGILPNSFDIYRDRVHSCRLVIERTDPARDRIKVRFRNSFCVFEMLDIPMSPRCKTGYDSGEDAEFYRLDAAGYFSRERERQSRTLTMSVKTAPVRRDEVPLLMDMIGSEEVYLIGAAPAPLKALPELEGIEYTGHPEAPEIFALRFKAVSDEENIMEDIDDGMEYHSRIFSRHFSKEFN